MKKNALYLIIIGLACLILFYKPLFSGQPLGLDTLGHLSKVSYIHQYSLANWDMSWYSGTLFLKLYSPLFYYIAAVFPSPILAGNFISFLSILLSSIGIYLLVRYKTKNERVSLLSGLSYLTVLSISYYWISTGNLPYFFALWTIPFSLYFLEKSIIEKKKVYFVVYSIIFAIGILTHIVIGFLIGVLMILRFLFEGFNLANIKRIVLYGLLPVLISSFWFIPFLFYSSSAGGYEGYIPTLIQLFGFKDNIAWGLQAGGIGILAYLFIFTLLFLKKYWKNKQILFYLSSVIILGFLLLGGLGSHYPLGVDPVRFVLPFSILLICFLGLVSNELGIFKRKWIFVLICLILIIGIAWNAAIINKNFERFSYYKVDSRYGIFLDIMNDNKFPIKNEFTNYRFGTSKFIFGETLNYFMPCVSQTFGYQDAGMLNAPRYYDMRWHIWTSNDTNDAIYWLDWFGIKYFESENLDFVDKFKADERFRIILNSSEGYDFTLFEYLKPKHIISLVDSVNSPSLDKEKEFSWERTNPDKVIVRYDSLDKNDAVVFKEFYHKSWKAKDIQLGVQYNLEKVGPGFMAVHPLPDSKGVIFYQSKTIEEIFGLILTILGIITLIRIKKFE